MASEQRIRLIHFCFITFAASLILSGVVSGQIPSQTTDPTEDVPHIEIIGEVNAGEPFEREIAPGLFFYLKPVSSGWSITIAPEEACDPALREIENYRDDFVYVATPPFRFRNAQALNTDYGTPAREAVGYPRDFNFVTDCDSFATEMKRVQAVLWPAEAEPDDLVNTQASLGESADGKGLLEILDSRIDESAGELGAIEWVRFRVELEFP